MKATITIGRIMPMVLLMIYAVLGSCSADRSDNPAYVCAACTDTPDALAIHDADVRGIYKGIVAGSSGTVSINIQNGASAITATLVLDGITAVLTSDVSVVDGQAYVAPFTGSYNGSPVSVTFQVGLGGSSPIMVSSDIPGHANASFEIFKETSDSLIEAFEGTLTAGGDTGTFNIVLSTGLAKWGGIAKNDNSGTVTSGHGIISGSGQLIDEDGTNIGKVTGDTFSGSFTGGHGEQVVLTGQRTL